MQSSNFEITNKTKGRPPRLPFGEMKEKVLGKGYDLSLVLIGSTRSRNLNKTYRKKDKPANVLSFPYSEESGEIFIDLGEAKKQAPKYEKSYRAFMALLFIHGMYHLKGFEHGGKMEQAEKKILKTFDM